MAYSDGDLLVRSVMHNKTGLPADDVINDWAFHFTNPLSQANMDIVFQFIDDFFNVGDGVLQAVGGYIGDSIDRAATHQMDFYKIQAGNLGAPVYSVPWLGPIAAGVNTNLPSEVAAVASFHATLVGLSEEVGTTRPRARRRGRVYIGPLTTEVYSQIEDNPRLNAAFTDALRFAMAELRDATNTTFGAGFGWSVWSRADQTLRPVVGGWTDDAFDTQRRRGVLANTRVNWGNP